MTDMINMTDMTNMYSEEGLSTTAEWDAFCAKSNEEIEQYRQSQRKVMLPVTEVYANAIDDYCKNRVINRTVIYLLLANPPKLSNAANAGRNMDHALRLYTHYRGDIPSYCNPNNMLKNWYKELRRKLREVLVKDTDVLHKSICKMTNFYEIIEVETE
jgi:hypothetical protein